MADLAPPSVDDLFALYRLCGGDAERVIELLSRLWGAQPNVIAPTVHAWLGQLPASYKPPSRSRSAPPALPSWFLHAGRAAARAHPGSSLARSSTTLALPAAIKPPPLSAPAVAGKGAGGQIGRSFDMMALQQAVERGSSKLPASQRVQSFALPPMPEGAPIEFMSAAAWNVGPPNHGPGHSNARAAQPHGGFPLRAPAAGPGGGVMGGSMGGGAAFLTEQGGGEDALGAFMYAARMGGGLSMSDRVQRGYGGRHMR